MPIEIRHLRTIEAVAQFGSLAAAAQRLHLTQSALSHQLRGLEAEFGVNILDRERGSQLRLSPAGEELLAAAREVLPRVRQLQEELKRRALGNSGRLRIAVECHTCFDWLTPAMDHFRENWPDVEMDLVSGFQQDPLPLLQSHQADLTVLTAPDAMAADITLHPLFAYEVVALVNPRHALASKPYLEPADFLEETLITYPVEDRRLDLFREFLQPAGIQPWRRRHAELTVIILQLVASGQGIAALPSWAVGSYGEKGYVRALPLGPQGLWQTLQAATTAEQSEQEHMRAFLEEIRASVAANLLGVKDIQGV
ncbi:LysR family transcriptional regulator [Acidithiobacillus sp. HP-6]|uniref:LysR family transcriptional regulator n=1 Tax=unclassified Acidithiobacillus TaxID=2614800 RepID=UPI00187A6079|nr:MULTISPECIES: LysR family transcriptional regulator [unclassified Acidithiobacillus]MBE7562596.1 LysR family transcriptional regulator [Acidithiobacillus sp. HP-6]MBE7568095.1 LysR family transcriptional regulator [Acidithiobacillus sp. HP-2]MDD5280435.1 LysR family transcriptional regulator [Acidithiobacillus sp.]